MMNITNEKDSVKTLMAAFKSGDENQMKEACDGLYSAIVESVKADFEDYQKSADKTILSQRGYRVLTSEETKFYEKFAQAAKASNPKQALTDLLTTDNGMPETIIEDVFRDLKEEHQLLSQIKFQYVKYLTSWLLNDNPEDQAVWGEINAEIIKEIESGFKAISLTQGKLSGFLIIPLDMLDLGPAFLDKYIREVLKEVMACGLEYGIVKGIGVKGEPIGLIRDIHEGVSYNETDGYPSKKAIKVVDFTPKSYGTLVGQNMVKKENNKKRKITKLSLLCNTVDYFTKVMPATTVVNTNGEYKRDLFPIPTDVIQTNVLEDGEAILAILPEYFFGVGSSKEGTIEYSDEFKFLEDKRTYKTKMHGFGRAEDNTSAILLDISELDPAYITVKQETDEVSA